MNPSRYPFFLILIILLGSCNSSGKKEEIKSLKSNSSKAELRHSSEEFKEYWYSGQAEITSYQLSQERYNEIRKGTAVAIFVTEDFLPQAQVKANSSGSETVKVMKLNLMKNYNTGIYPYSIMTSSFLPIDSKGHALKIANSIQEWCGQVYMQLNNKTDYEIEAHSYFEGEGDQKLSLPKTWLEDELWSLIRINPEELPTGDLTILPSFEYLRLRHKEIKEYNAFATLKQGDSITVYTINYTALQRQLEIYFRNRFPYEIEKWEEINVAGDNDTLRLRTTATRYKRMKTDYWNKNRNEFAPLRDSLGLN